MYYLGGAGPPGVQVMCHLISYNISHSLHDELSDNITFLKYFFFAIVMCNVMCTILLLFVACMYTVNTVNCTMIQFTSFLSIVSISCYL